MNTRFAAMAYRFDPFHYDPISRCLFREDREIALKPKTRELLVLFLRNPHRLLTHDDIVDRLWPNTAVTDDSVRVQVFDLRKALGAEGDQLIRTVPREGYRWEADVGSGEESERAGRGAELVCRLSIAKREIELVEGENILGRDRGVAVWIDETAVSRHHARITVADGVATLEDLGSKNGTYLRGQKVGAAMVLSDGDEIAIGPVTMTVRLLLRSGSTETQENRR